MRSTRRAPGPCQHAAAAEPSARQCRGSSPASAGVPPDLKQPTPPAQVIDCPPGTFSASPREISAAGSCSVCPEARPDSPAGSTSSNQCGECCALQRGCCPHNRIHSAQALVPLAQRAAERATERAAADRAAGRGLASVLAPGAASQAPRWCVLRAGCAPTLTCTALACIPGVKVPLEDVTW